MNAEAGSVQPRITRIDAGSARKISAGQVITDLSSVVKELLENALDAGASTVAIRLDNFGTDRITVEDDGCGIPLGEEILDVSTGALKEGAATPLLASRATTKRTDSGDVGGDDLSQAAVHHSPLSSSDEAMSSDPSLGFRGEALHSLAHVSRVTIDTMNAFTAPRAVRLVYDAEKNVTRLSLGGTRQSTGTTVTVEALFGQLPVRHREYVKNRRRQVLRATQLVKQYAVSHPGVKLVMQHQEDPPHGATVSLVSFTGSNDLQRSVTEAYGGLCLSRMAAVRWECSFGTFSGFVSKVSSGGRMSADHQVFALDSRLVDLPGFAKAINDAFTQCLPNSSQKASVAFFLCLSVDRSALAYDVNLTPNKRKVLLAKEPVLAEELHRAALREFSTMTEEAPLNREARIAANQVADARIAEEIRTRRTAVSATAFTQFVFKRDEAAEPVADARVSAEGRPSVELPKIGTLLYTDEDGTEESARPSLDGASHSTVLLGAVSDDDDDDDDDTRATSDEKDNEDEEQADATAERASPDDCGGPPRRRHRSESLSYSNEAHSAPSLYRVLSDVGNPQRPDAARVPHAFPSLSQLAMTPLMPVVHPTEHAECDACGTGDGKSAADMAASPAGRRSSTRCFSALGEQTDAELTMYFGKNAFKDMIIIGQFNHGFIMARLGDDLFVIDQHASDEKFNYERLMRSYVAKPQPLVVPVPVAMDAQEVDLALAHAETLTAHGFKVRRGDDATKLLVCSIPVLPYDVVSAADVLELVQQLVQYGAISKPLRSVWHSMATKACRTSIMIGTALSHRTMRTILDHLSELDQPWNCPHGRPTLRYVCNLHPLHPNPPAPPPARRT